MAVSQNLKHSCGENVTLIKRSKILADASFRKAKILQISTTIRNKLNVVVVKNTVVHFEADDLACRQKLKPLL
ncbi:hypothetical protein M513_10572 [Trichuris suis]|uniref:Uncharacterized protein n=1 Tax=Trichuris suis TaxID=68888 RepID=A0A085LUB5_9BILA|nr:hypothetical protein M513_10572 [Trichuris suis]